MGYQQSELPTRQTMGEILNTQTDQLSIYLGQSAETSDFIVDCLAAWWTDNQPHYSHLDELVIDLDGGSATRSDRTQFIKRMVELSQTIGLTIRLIYYPPYHSKYNPIERCWAALEQYQPFWQRSETLPKWDITIVPT